MAKLEQKARKGLYGGFKPGSTGGPGTGKVKNTIKRKTADLKRAIGDVVSNVKDGVETRKNEKATEELAAMGSSKNPRFLQDALNPAQNAAMTAGGSRPMTAMNNPQVDPITGMPITPGGQPNMNPNFIGGMANSNMPTTGMLAQEKYDAAKADVNGNGVTEDWEEANAKKFTVAQEKKMMRTMKPLPLAVPDKSDSTAMYMGGNAPGQYNNPIWKPAADSAAVRFPNIDASKIKQSDIFKKGDQLHEITRHIPIVNKRYGTEESSKKAFDEAMVDQQRLTQSRRSTKCMRVKKK
jgi:hypothetical protein